MVTGPVGRRESIRQAFRMVARKCVPAVFVAVVLESSAPDGTATAGTAITACGQIVTTDAYLTHDLDCSTTGLDGVHAGASGITIDLKGFTIRGDVYSNNGVLVDGFDGVAIK